MRRAELRLDVPSSVPPRYLRLGMRPNFALAVTCPLVPNVPHLRSGSCTSPRAFGLGFLQTPPRGDALALLLAFGSSYTWHRDLHPISSASCLAWHTRPGSAAPAFGRRLQSAVRCHLRPKLVIGLCLELNVSVLVRHKTPVRKNTVGKVSAVVFSI
jgi:hypothetical protein